MNSERVAEGLELGAPVIDALARPSSVRSCFHVVLEWVLIVVGAWVAASASHPLATVAAIVWIGARQHALVALAHEATHGLLLPRRWNDLVGEVLLAWPLFLSLRAYRETHLEHHRFLSSPSDPDWVRNRPDRLAKAAGRWEKMALLMGLRSRQHELLAMFVGRRERTGSDRRWLIGRLVYYAALAACISLLGAWQTVALYWLLPFSTWFLFVMRLRGISEHWAVDDRTPLGKTRTLLVSPLERLLFFPKHMGYHVEHHLHPNVPFHRLGELHARLLERAVFRRKAHITNGLPGLAREVLAFPQRL